MPTVTVIEKGLEAEGKDAIQATTTRIGKGRQALRDIPQSVTVVTEKLVDDRNLDTLRDVLHNTAGITFLAAEGGEEDIRLRGFSLAATGDIFVDGMRDPAFYERDTFNNDRIEVLRGSASMLFGRGSTGGAVNQPTACALPGIAQALNGSLPILVDGGIRRGTDVLKAVALGASAVLIGRPVIHGLANAGAVGVAHVIRLLRDELEIAMALSGCARLSDASTRLLRNNNGRII